VIAIAEEGKFLHAPDVYMEKIAVGPAARGVIDLKASATDNLKKVAKAKGCLVEDLTVTILDRPRHEELIREVRSTGARIWLIGDGDVSAAIATCKEDSGVDVLMGSGGAPEGVIAAAALRCMGGDFVGRLIFRKDEERGRARKMGIEDLEKVYRIDELAQGKVMFCATGVTPGALLNGVRFFSGGARTHSVVMRSETRTVRWIEAEHHFESKPQFRS
jgi:fructose-1,6-bisphosphatase II